MVGVATQVQLLYHLLKNFELLSLLVEVHQLEQDRFGNVLAPELARDNGWTQQQDELVSQIFLSEKLVDIREQIVDLLDAQAELDRNFYGDLFD